MRTTKMQKMVDCINQAGKMFGMKINSKKNENNEIYWK